MWAHQNRILHNSPQAKYDILEKQVNNQIWTIYTNGTQAVPCDVIGLLRKLLDQILQLPLTMKQQWLDSIASTIAQKQWHEYGHYLGKQHFMATWVIKNETRSRCGGKNIHLTYIWTYLTKEIPWNWLWVNLTTVKLPIWSGYWYGIVDSNISIVQYLGAAKGRLDTIKPLLG